MSAPNFIFTASALSFLLALYAPFADAQVAHAQDRAWQIEASLGTENVQSGRLQTTAGGTAGSATPEYPTFSELGLESGTAWQLRLQRNFDHQYVALGTQQFNPEAHAHLKQSLIVQGQTFPANSDVSSRLKFNQYQLEYGYHFDINPKLSITPLAALDLWQFSLHMQSPSATGQVSRSYHKATIQLGAQANYQLTPRLTLGARTLSSLPLSGQPQITNVGIFSALQLWHSPSSNGSIVVALQDRSLQYNDHERQARANSGTNTMSNSILLHAFIPSIGLSVAF